MSDQSGSAGKFSNPSAQCDLVMKGGITSGIVYPPAVLQLADKYRFRSIGGASAGAIAAAVTAAAEYGRESGGFERLKETSDWLAEGTNLFDLCQPSKQTKPLMTTLLALNEAVAKRRQDEKPDLSSTSPASTPTSRHRSKRPIAGGLMDVVRSLAKGGNTTFRVWAAIGAAIGFTLCLIFWRGVAGSASLLSVAGIAVSMIFGALPGAVVGAVTATLVKLGAIALVDIPKNHYGMCSGLTSGAVATPGLTEWLHAEINRLAGFSQRQTPLTVGELAAKTNPETGDSWSVTLRTVTTNLSHGQPYFLPFDNEMFFFRRSELEHLLPAPVVKHLVDNRRRSSRLVLADSLSDFCNLPKPADIPIVLLARMSLSFPLLLSAIPLYAVRRDAFAKRKKEGDPKAHSDVVVLREESDLERSWFSDGGISSNFPIHFFDAWLPTRPTFGINLTNLPPADFADDPATTRGGMQRLRSDSQVMVAQADPVENAHAQDSEADESLADDGTGDPAGDYAVFLPRANRPIHPSWSRIEGLPAFIDAIWATAQNFRDNTQARLPSYRERIVQVRFAPHEGGLNLSMGRGAIESILEKGARAGQLLRDFDFNDHRWVRFRVLMAQLEEELGRFATAYPDSKTYADVFAGFGESRSYPRDAAWCAEAAGRLTTILDLVRGWRERDESWRAARPAWQDKRFFGRQGPKPEPALRVTPR